jgi:hypothetical protein
VLAVPSLSDADADRSGMEACNNGEGGQKILNLNR